MFDGILNLDQYLLEFINIKLSNPVFDFLMPLLDTNIGFILPVFIFWVYTVYKHVTKRKFLLLLIPIVIGFTDQIGLRIKKLEFNNLKGGK